VKKLLILFIFSFSFLSFGLYAAEKTTQERQDDCAKKAGYSWDSTRVMCIYSKKASASKDAFKKCENLTDEAAINACVKKNGHDLTGVSEGEQNKDGDSYIGSSLLGAYSALLHFGALSEKSAPSCTSKTIFSATSLGFVVTHYMTQSSSKKKFGDLSKEYEKIPENYQKQVKAFEYLKQEQQIIKDIADEKVKYYTALSLGYGLAFGFAVYESVPGWGDANGACQGSFTSLDSSKSLVIASGLAMGYTFSLKQAASKESDKATLNIAKIDEIIAGFSGAMENSCPGGREDQTKLKCYCMNADGSKNDNRSLSDKCKNFWDSLDLGLFANSDYSKAGTVESGCITITQKYDSSCQCKKFKDKASGKNACLKVRPNSLGFGNFAGVSAFSPGLTASSLEKIGNGQGASAIGSGTGQAALKTKKAAAKLMKLLNSKLASNNQPPIDLKKESKKLLSSNAVRGYASQAGSALSSGSGDLSSPEINNAIKKIEKKNGDFLYKNSKSKGRGRSKKKKFSYNFGGSSKSKSSNILDFGKDKKYDYKNNDINQRSDVSIFKIISSRYIKSGLKALFQDE